MKKQGNDYRLFVESATPGTYNEIKGQNDLSVSRSGGTIDTSTKDGGAYATSAPGQKSLSISFNLIPDLPDANGYTRFETLALATPQVAFNVQIKAGATIVFTGSVYASECNTSFGQNDSVKCTGTLIAAAAPTVDALQ
jgi:hypothetical protein